MAIRAAWRLLARTLEVLDRGRDVLGVSQDDAGVDVELSDGPPLRARYVVG